MNEIIEFSVVVIIIFLSTLVRSSFGFGNALIAMPLLALVIGVKEATPLVALAGLVISLIMLIREWRELVWKDTLVLLISSLAGLPLGLLLLTALPEPAVPFGFLAGILGGAYNANGPPIVIYGVMRGWKKEAFRASLQGFFFVSSEKNHPGGFQPGDLYISYPDGRPNVLLMILS